MQPSAATRAAARAAPGRQRQRPGRTRSRGPPALRPARSRRPPSPRSPNCSWWCRLRRGLSPWSRRRACVELRRPAPRGERPAGAPQPRLVLMRPIPPAAARCLREEELQDPRPPAEGKPMCPWCSPAPRQPPRRRSQAPRTALLTAGATRRRAARLCRTQGPGCRRPRRPALPQRSLTSLRRKGAMR